MHDGGDKDTNVPRPDYVKDIESKEFREGGIYYFEPCEYEPATARDENYFQSLGYCLCPPITICSFIVIVSLVEIVVFIISCCLYGGPQNTALLAPKSKSLEVLGWQDNKKIKNDFEIWRWLTPTFLHGSLDHIAGNVVMQLLLGVGIENGIGTGYFALLYLTCGIGGNLLSAIASPAGYGVGASTADFGLVGFYISYLITNSCYMARVRLGQLFWIAIVSTIMIATNLNIGADADSHVDNFGHLGGFITGIFAGLAISEWFDARARSKGRTPDRFTEEGYAMAPSCCKGTVVNWIGTILYVAWFIALLIWFYVFTDVDLP